MAKKSESLCPPRLRQLATCCRGCCCNHPIYPFLLLAFFIAPACCCGLALAIGCPLAAVEGWSVGDGYWYILCNIAGTPPVTDVSPDSTIGEIVDVFASALALAATATVTGLSTMLTIVTKMPERLHLDSISTWFFFLVTVIPLSVSLACIFLGLVLAGIENAIGKEGVEPSAGDGIYFIVSVLCGIGNPLTKFEPQTASGQSLCVIVGVMAEVMCSGTLARKYVSAPRISCFCVLFVFSCRVFVHLCTIA